MASSAIEMEKTVLSALEVLYQKHLQPEQQQAADAYLRGFQLTPDAFAVCVSLLDRFLPQSRTVVTSAAEQQQQAEIVPILFFASQTLANKLRRQHAFPEHAGYSYFTWSQKIITWLATKSASIPKLVQTQLVLALVACMPRIPSHDIQAQLALDASRGIAQPFAGNSASGGVISLVLNQLTQAQVAPAMVTELLVVLVEEVAEIQERSARDQMQTEIDQWAVTVLDQILPQIMHDAVQQQSAGHSGAAEAVVTQQMVLRAVKNWLRYSSVSPVVVVNNPLLQSFVAFLNQDDLFDVSVDLVVELVRCYYDVERDLVLIQWLVPQLMQLKDAFQKAANEEDTDKCLGLCRIFTEMSESYITLLVGDLEMGQAAVVDLLLDCMSYPDVEIADVTIPFWFRFIEELLHLDKRDRESKLAKLAPNLIRLAGICMQHIQFQDDFPRLPSDKQQDFKAFRHELGDILRDFCELLGVESILQHCVQGLEHIFQMPVETRRWEAVEAHLFCFRSIARHVERSRPEVVSASIQLIFQHLPQFSEHPAICYTSCLIVSRYVEWLKNHSSFLPQQLEFLNQNIMKSAQDPRFTEWEVARAASAAIRSIAMDCWPLLGSEITAFYLHVEKHDILVVDDQTFILEGMLAGVKATRDMAAVMTLLDQILEPLGQRLGGLFAAASTSSTTTVSASVASSEMARLICIYDNLDVDMKKMGAGGFDQHPLMILTEKMWPLFNQILAQFRGKDDLVERVCRCYKRILRTCGSQFKPFLPQMVENLLSFYQSDPKSSYLYAGNMVLKYFYEDQSDEMVGIFAKLVHTFAETTLPIFQDRATMQTHPDVIEEFFFLMQRCVKYVPQVLLAPVASGGSSGGGAPLLLDSLFQCAVVSLDISHNDANKAALCFLEDTLAQGLQAGSPKPTLASFELALQQSFFGGEPPVGGTRLVNQLLMGIVLASVPVSRLEADYGSIAGVLVQFAKLHGQKLQEWMAAWFIDAMATRPTQPAAVGFLTTDEANDFQRDLFSSPNERTFRRVVRHFGKLCASRNTAFKGDEQK
uniref:Exportin-1/Importin-beta-like domain-containing protein n=1 Tax=Globisporangium ultimum (strain ATCC 200006 / CBS 805.95 / DAOM BR144) TaxID=431595 RepID=K3X7U5_GLOUD